MSPGLSEGAVSVELSFAQYRSGFDPVMDAILRYRSIAGALAPAVNNGDAADLERRYRAFKADPATAWIPTEREINALGYELLGEHRFPLAETVLRLNTESYPGSANTFDSLGEARLAREELAPARESYARALELAPESDNARKMLAVIDARIAGRSAGHP
jgi:tetratricopeptide (TPR) repeat protein